MSFLTAEWRKLAFANYAIEPEVLKKYLPLGTELDFYQDKCYVSLVAFMFINTKLLGIRVPFHSNFEEVNLRFYVKRREGNVWKRGVVFIQEIVPKPALTFIANSIYQEHYQTLPMNHKWEVNNEERIVEYHWKKNRTSYSFKVLANKKTSSIDENSFTEFITEHYWGYTKISNEITNEYEVKHPKWRQYLVYDSQIEVDFGKNYGSDFSFLNQKKPDTVILAEGSEITVEKKAKIN